MPQQLTPLGRRIAATLLTLTAAATAIAIAPAPAQASPPVSPPPVVTLEYDAQGNPKRTIQAPGVAGYNLITSHGYDRLHRHRDTTDARSGVTRLDYNGREDLIQVTDPRNLVTQYPRNGLGEATSLISPDTGTAAHTFDAAGNLRTRQDSRGALASHSYDVLNRLTSTTHTQAGQASQVFSWTYDQTGAGFSFGVGRLTSTSYAGGSTRLAYDALGRLVSQTSNGAAGSSTLATAYEYDAAGNITALTYPSGRKLFISYTNGQPSAMSLAPTAGGAPALLISGIQWQPFGPVRSWQWAMNGGSRLHERVFDLHGRVVRYPVGNLVRDLSYDAADRIAAYTHFSASTGVAAPAANQSFAYDELGRLTGVVTSGWNSAIGYDANGNRTGTALNGIANTYTTDSASNRVVGISNPTRSLAYDAAGNTTADTGAIPYTATYDASNRLGSVAANSQTTNYSYNAHGQRVAKVTESTAVVVCSPSPSGKLICAMRPQPAPVVTRFAYDQQGRLLGEYDSVDQTIQEFVWLGDTPIAVVAPEWINNTYSTVAYYIHADHLNTPRQITDQAANIRWSWDAEPFGAPAPNTNPSGLGTFTFNLRFPGQYFDVESGLSYNWHRDYDAGLGRYTQSDPIGLAGGINTYAYVGGNPISRVDPTGLAYFAGRPLQGLPWLGPLSNNPLDNAMNTAISHEQLFFEDGKPPANMGFFGDSKLKTENSLDGYRRLPGQYNDCVMRMAARAANTGTYNLATNNCQSWADRARDQYNKLMQSGVAAAVCGL